VNTVRSLDPRPNVCVGKLGRTLFGLKPSESSCRDAAGRTVCPCPIRAEIAIRPFVGTGQPGSEAHPSLPRQTNLDKSSDTRSGLLSQGTCPAGTRQFEADRVGHAFVGRQGLEP